MRGGAWKIGLARDLGWAELTKGRGKTGMLGVGAGRGVVYRE